MAVRFKEGRSTHVQCDQKNKLIYNREQQHHWLQVDFFNITKIGAHKNITFWTKFICMCILALNAEKKEKELKDQVTGFNRSNLKKAETHEKNPLPSSKG